MSRIFSPDNGFFTFINKMVDTLWLGLLWCVISLGPAAAGFFIGGPTGNETLFRIILALGIIISGALIGPASTALYYATVKVTRRSRSYATKEFFRSFKLNFRVASLTSLIYTVFAYLMFVDFNYANALEEQNNSVGNVMFVVFLAGCILAGVALVWIFPILSRFTVGIGGLFRNALLIGARHLVRSVILILIWAVIGVACYLFQELLIAMIILVPIIPGLVALLRSFVIEPVLKKYTSEAEGTPEETGVDDWYRE